MRTSFHGTTGSWLAPVSVSESGRRVQVAEPADRHRRHAGRRLGVAAADHRGLLHLGSHPGRDPAARRRLGREALLSDPAIEGRCPHIGVGPDGATTVVWESYDGATYKVATRVHRGGSWEPQTDLTQSIDSESIPQLAIARMARPS